MKSELPRRPHESKSESGGPEESAPHETKSEFGLRTEGTAHESKSEPVRETESDFVEPPRETEDGRERFARRPPEVRREAFPPCEALLPYST